MVGCEDVVLQLQVKDWKGLASFGDFCITATFQGSSQETKRCREARRSGRLPLVYVWRQRRQRLPRMRSADVRVEVSSDNTTATAGAAGDAAVAVPRLAFLHFSLREAQDMLTAPDKAESYSWRQLVGGSRGAQLLVGAFFRPAASCDLLQPPAASPHSPAGPQRTPAPSRPHSAKSGVAFTWDADNQFFRMEPPTPRDQLYRFATRVREARDLDLLVLGHRGRGGGGGLRLECALGGFPALTAGSLANALAAPSADDRSALCFRGSVDAFRRLACAEPATLRLLDGRGNRIGYASFQLGVLLSGPQFTDFSAGDDSCNVFEAEHVLTMACDEGGSVPRGADGSVPTVTIAASLRRISFIEWEHRGQIATDCSGPHQHEGAGHRSSSSASPAHYSPISSSRSLGLTLGGDGESTGEAGGKVGDLGVSPDRKPNTSSRSCPSLPTDVSRDSAARSIPQCRSYPVTPPQHSSGDEIPVAQCSPSSVSQDKSRCFPDIIPDQSAPPVTTSLTASDANKPPDTCLTRYTLSPSATDSETRFILEHMPHDSIGSSVLLSEGASERTPSILSGSSSALSIDLSPATCCAEIPECELELPENQIPVERLRRASTLVPIASPAKSSPDVAEKDSGSPVPRLILDTDSIGSGHKAAPIRASDVAQSFSFSNRRSSPILNDAESVTSTEMDLPLSSDKGEMRCPSPLPSNNSQPESHYRAIKTKKHARRIQSSGRAATRTMKSQSHPSFASDTNITSGRCKAAKQMNDASSKRDFDAAAKISAEMPSPFQSPREDLSYTGKLTTQYLEGNTSHLMYRARYSVTKIIVFDESLCGVLFIGFRHQQLEEQNVLSKVVIKDPNETVTPSGLVGTVKVCSLRGHVLEQVAALPPMLNVSHHKVRCDPHLVQAELSFAVAEPGKFALYRVATGEVVGTVHADLRILGPYRCPAAICNNLAATSLPYTDEELAEDKSQWVAAEDERLEVMGDHNRYSWPDSERHAETGKSAWREREMEVLATIDDMYADVCRMTEETQMLQERDEWLDPNVRRVWMWRLEILEDRYESACRQYREHYGIRN